MGLKIAENFDIWTYFSFVRMSVCQIMDDMSIYTFQMAKANTCAYNGLAPYVLVHDLQRDHATVMVIDQFQAK